MNLVERDARHIVGTYRRLPVDIVRTEGSYVYDASGKRYLDLVCGLAVHPLGHRHPAVLDAISRQLDRYLHVSNLFVQQPQLELAERLARMSGYPRVFFCNSGTEATEAAVKLVRRWGSSRNRDDLIGFSGAFHGRTMGALSLMSTSKYRNGYAPFLPGIVRVPFNDAEVLRHATGNHTAAVFVEFLQGEAGVVPATDEFVQALFDLREEHGFLVVADEVQSGVGRTGKFSSFERWNVRPDIVLLAKAVGGGLPLGVMLVEEGFSDVFGIGGHGTTFGGNPVSCAAGGAVLEVIEREELMTRAERVGERFMRGLQAIRSGRNTVIRDLRGWGCMIGVELSSPADVIMHACLERGLLVNVTRDTILRLLPAYTIGDEQVDEALAILGDELKKTTAPGAVVDDASAASS